MCNTPLHHLLKVSRGSMVASYSWCAQAAYEVLTEQQMRERQAQDVQSVTSVLGISDGEAARVLRHYKWCTLCTLPCRRCMSSSWSTLMLERYRLTDTDLLTGTRTASTMNTSQTWTTFGKSWVSWTRLRSHPAQWQQQQRQRGHQSGEPARRAVLEQRSAPGLEHDQASAWFCNVMCLAVCWRDARPTTLEHRRCCAAFASRSTQSAACTRGLASTDTATTAGGAM